MESIDRLRDEIESARKSVNITSRVAKKLLDIADAIEREHKQTLHSAVCKAHADGERNALRQERSASEDYRRGLEDGKAEGYALAHTTTKQEADAYAEMESFHDRLCRASERREDVTLWGVDYTALPVDADGEPIHIGDVMESDDGETFKVCRLQLFSSGWAIDGGKFTQSEIHHHTPTVEDVLREFAGAWAEWKDGAAMMNPVETFAAKLTLRGDE